MDDVELLPLDAGRTGRRARHAAYGQSASTRPLGRRRARAHGSSRVSPSHDVQATWEWNGIELKMLSVPMAPLPRITNFGFRSVRLAVHFGEPCAPPEQPRLAATRLRDFCIAEANSPPTASISPSAICHRKPRRCARCTSPRAATWVRRLWSAFDRAETSIATCGPPLERTGPVPAPRNGVISSGGVPAGHITSAAALPLASAPRVFALAVVRAEAEVESHPFNYTDGTAPGTARILAEPPTF